MDEIYEDTDTKKLSLLINLKNKNNFLETNQIGFFNNKIENFELDENNLIVKHIYSSKRVVFISDLEKVKEFFHNNKFEQKYDDLQSLIIYPIKIYGQIKALLFLGFSEKNSDNLAKIVKKIEQTSVKLKKLILKIV